MGLSVVFQTGELQSIKMVSNLKSSLNFTKRVSNPKNLFIKDSCNLFVIKNKTKVVIQSADSLLTDCGDSSYNVEIKL